jgi:hypothetical protein
MYICWKRTFQGAGPCLVLGLNNYVLPLWIRKKSESGLSPYPEHGRYLRVFYLGPEGRLREELRAQHSVRSDGSSENKQIPAQNEFQFPDSNKVHSPVKILIGDKTATINLHNKFDPKLNSFQSSTIIKIHRWRTYLRRWNKPSRRWIRTFYCQIKLCRYKFLPKLVLIRLIQQVQFNDLAENLTLKLTKW